MRKKGNLLLQHIIDIIESAAPLRWQEEWDNSGLQVGNRNADINKVLLATDVTESVVSEAVQLNCQLIISHHPLLFHPLKQICAQNPQARCIETAIRNNIAIYSSHTAMDAWIDGVSGRMAQKLSMTNVRILCPVGENENQHGLGVIAELPKPMTLMQLLEHIKTAFGAPVLRYVPGNTDIIKTVALCGGAGAEFAQTAIQRKADAFITADVKYHDFLDLDGAIALIDMDHWVSEHFTREIFQELLHGKVQTLISQEDKSPIRIF